MRKHDPIGLIGRPRSVRCPLDPNAGESSIGYFHRVAAHNVIPIEFLHAEVNLNNPTGDDRAYVDNAVKVFRCTSNALNHLYRPSRPAHLYENFFGQDIPRRLFDLKRQWISPRSMERSAYHRSLWMLKPLPFCVESWEFLTRACGMCGKELAWDNIENIVECGACGTDYRNFKGPQVCEGDRDTLAFLVGRINPLTSSSSTCEALPSELANLNSGELFELALLFAREWRTDPGPLRPEAYHLKAHLWCKRLAEGVRTLLNFHETALDELRRSNRNTVAPQPLVRLQRAARRHSRPALREALTRLLSAAGEDHKSGVQRLRRNRTENAMLSKGEAAARLRINRTALSELLGRGELNRSEARGSSRIHVWLFPTEVEALAERLKNNISVAVASKVLDAPVNAVEQLVAMGGIKTVNNPVYLQAKQGLRIDHASVILFKKELQDSTRKMLCSEEGWVKLHLGLRGVGGVEKPWGPVLLGNIRGQLSDGLAMRQANFWDFSQLLISYRDLRRHVIGHANDPAKLRFDRNSYPVGISETFSRVQAGNYLNCYAREFYWLLQSGHFGDGMNGDGELPAAPIRAFGCEFISSIEIGVRLGIPIRSVHVEMERRGVHRPFQIMFWRRGDVETLLARQE